MLRLCIRPEFFASLLVASACVSSGNIAVAADGSALFKEKCAACHSIGEGPRVGPDLKGVVARRGIDGATMAIFDPAKAGLSPSMPKLVTQPEAAAISAYLESQGSKGRAEKAAAPGAQPTPQAEAESTPQEINLGRQLFEGSVRFDHGGPACNACHHVSHEAVAAGGVLAADLTQSFSRMDTQGFSAIVADAPFPVMRVAYEGRPINREEVRALAGFLQQVKTHNVTQQPGSHGWRMFFGSAAGVLVLTGFFWIVGARRKKRCVNQDIYDRQIRSE